MTDTLTTPDVDVDVDLEATIPCEVREALVMANRIVSEKPCGNTAEWAGNYPCCGKTAVLCHPHFTHPRTTFLCTKCNKQFSSGALVGVRGL